MEGDQVTHQPPGNATPQPGNEAAAPVAAETVVSLPPTERARARAEIENATTTKSLAPSQRGGDSGRASVDPLPALPEARNAEQAIPQTMTTQEEQDASLLMDPNHVSGGER
jgi:hypothetical protein